MKMAVTIAGILLAGGLYVHYQTPRGVRNNNPLNLRVSADNWQGATGDDGDFVQFESAFFGLRAAARVLRTYRDTHKLSTIRGIVSRWAPTTENNTAAYIDSVSKKTGLGADIALASASDYQRIVSAMIYHENGQQPYTDDVIKRAVIEGLYT